jgi:type I restriction enzyme S subunit
MLEVELETKLEAELKARLQQYSYCRDKLTTCDEDTTCNERWTTLSEIGTFTRGRRFTNNDFVESGVGCIHYGEIYTHYGLCASETKSFLRPELAASLRMAKKGDLVIAGTGESVEDIGKAVAWLGSEEVAVHDDCYIFSHSMNPKYLSYFFQSSHFNAQKVKYAAGAKMIRVSSEGFGKIRIYVPPFEEQDQIVSVLENFDPLVNELASSLPAEIKARRQQHEYYRNRLLTFRKAP